MVIDVFFVVIDSDWWWLMVSDSWCHWLWRFFSNDEGRGETRATWCFHVSWLEWEFFLWWLMVIGISCWLNGSWVVILHGIELAIELVMDFLQIVWSILVILVRLLVNLVMTSDGHMDSFLGDFSHHVFPEKMCSDILKPDVYWRWCVVRQRDTALDTCMCIASTRTCLYIKYIYIYIDR